MKPTKKQKLKWIEGAMWNLANENDSFSCDAFFSVSPYAYHWYEYVLEDLGGVPSSFGQFSEFGSRFGQPAMDGRLLWLSFLHLWVSEWVIK